MGRRPTAFRSGNKRTIRGQVELFIEEGLAANPRLETRRDGGAA